MRLAGAAKRVLAFLNTSAKFNTVIYPGDFNAYLR